MADEGKDGGAMEAPPPGRLAIVAATGKLDADEGFNKQLHNTTAEMNPTTMDGVGVFEGDFVEIKARRRTLVCRVTACDDLADHTVALNQAARKNLASKLDDFVGCTLVELQQLRIIRVAAIEETVEGISGDLKGLFLDPYFSADSIMPVVQGELINCLGPMKSATFKVLEIDPKPDGKPYGYVNVGMGSSVFLEAKAISREDGEADLNAIGYDDIGGLKEQLQTIRETIELPIRHPKVFTTIGVKPPKGVLMHGPPGCGKTLIAKALANETGASFITINGPEIMSGAAGGSEKNLRDIFESAAESAPAVVFIDEIDSIAPNRDKVSDDKMRRVVATLLTCMDGLKSGDKVLVIGATNRPNSLDPALRRAGRFDTEVVIPVPSEAGRLEILRILTKKQKLADDVDLKKLAAITHGYVGADLGALCMKAAVTCIRLHARGVLDMDEEDLPAEFLENIRVGMAHFMQAIDVTSPSMMREVAVETPDVKFADIGGLEDVKTELREMIEMPVKNPRFFEEMGIQPPKGCLMYGPPGCGKTMLAKAMANECSCNFISIKGPQMLSKWFGEAEENVRDVFEKARQASPCILFFDELDSIAQQRGGFGAQSAGGAADRVVNQLLTEMDGMAARTNLFIIGATNRPDTLDSAIRRPGRLDQLIYIPVPDLDARKAVFKATLRKTKVDRDIDFNRLAADCDGMTGADITGLCQMAVKMSVRRKLKLIIEGKVEEARDLGVSADEFERARLTSRQSVTPHELASYMRAKKAMAAETGGSTMTVGNEDKVTGRYMMADAGASGGAAGASDSKDGGVSDDDDFYD